MLDTAGAWRAGSSAALAACMGLQAQAQAVLPAFYLQLDFLDLNIALCPQ